MASLVMLAINLRKLSINPEKQNGQQNNDRKVHVVGKVKTFQKGVRKKTHASETMRATFSLSHNFFKVSAIVMMTFTSQKKTQI